MKQADDKERLQRAEEIARRIWKLSGDRLLVNLRFLDVALASLTFCSRQEEQEICCDGKTVFYHPLSVINRYRKEPNEMTRTYLHLMLHRIFHHTYRYESRNRLLWDIAADMAVESAILGLELRSMETSRDPRRREVLSEWEKSVGVMTAERIYRKLQEQTPDRELRELFSYDSHKLWAAQESIELTDAEWKKISERVKAELKVFSEEKQKNKGMIQNLEEATREHYDYGDFLRRFRISGEEMQVNDEEFDYVYYTYGLQLYGNLPLVEPLEYRDVKKIKEFVIALDTSASCSGSLVQSFLNKTYSILTSEDHFFSKVNIHIIQCDSQIQSDTKITCRADFEEFIKQGKLTGLGSTDFRPVFTYVNQCIERKEFENLKGLIYFTDGYGIFPLQKPPYDTAFVFPEREGEPPQTPPWAIRLVLSDEEIGNEEGESV